MLQVPFGLVTVFQLGSHFFVPRAASDRDPPTVASHIDMYFHTQLVLCLANFLPWVDLNSDPPISVTRWFQLQAWATALAFVSEWERERERESVCVCVCVLSCFETVSHCVVQVLGLQASTIMPGLMLFVNPWNSEINLSPLCYKL
jgi:hypothetical protein